MRLLCIIILILAFSGCKNDPMKGFEATQKEEVNMDEFLIQEQRKMLKQDSLRIEHFLENKEWKMNQSGTGLRYNIIETSTAGKVKSGDQIAVYYHVMTLNEDTLYSSKNSGAMVFVVDLSQAESGLHELVKYMRRGERARAIVPYHLGHGLAGDDYKIPPFTSLLMDVEIAK